MWEKVVIAAVILVLVWLVIKWRCHQLAAEDAEEECAKAQEAKEAEWALYTREAYDKWGDSLSRVPHLSGQLSPEDQ